VGSESLDRQSVTIYVRVRVRTGGPGLRFNTTMGIAQARRIAEHAHRGQIYAGGGPFADHLARVAERVGQWTRDPVTREAVWLYDIGATGNVRLDRLLRDLSPAVARVVEQTQGRRTDPSDRRAALIRYAVLTDDHRFLAGRYAYEDRRDEHARLADRLGLPRRN
jgi:(p)ppGpp synthase/HD superfamily hydrolase